MYLHNDCVVAQTLLLCTSVLRYLGNRMLKYVAKITYNSKELVVSFNTRDYLSKIWINVEAYPKESAKNKSNLFYFATVFQIRIRKFLGLPNSDPNPLVWGSDPNSDPDPPIVKKKY